MTVGKLAYFKFRPFLHHNNDTNESRMAPASKNLSHAAIWDDSALVNSWNDALEEHKVSRTSGINREQQS